MAAGAMGRAISNQQAGRSQTATSYVIESRIDGEFNGWSGETIFVLTNGQIWQQKQYAYTYRYAYRPRVWVVTTGLDTYLKVEGVSETILIKRVK